MIKKTFRLFFLLSNLLTLPFANANLASCEELLRSISDDNSLKAVIARATENLERAMKAEPLPNSSNIIKRREQVWTGEQGPKAFRSFLADDVKFLKTPDVNTEHPVMAMRKHPGNSSLLHVDLDFKGQKTSTKVYVSRPLIDSYQGIPSGKYLIGPEHKAVIWHIHGGGTPSAVAANASSKAQVYIKKGIPLVAVDQPGHGNGPTIAFLNDEEIFDWNYELMMKLIHPSVEIHLQGHSWGGMFTTRMWQLSDSDKYKRIVSYQAESPGADLSLGKGTPRERARLEKEINDNITDWESRAAPSDVDFLKNTVENRKMSPVAQEYTSLTDIFYRWEHLTDEEIAKRKRLNVLVGTYDGLVYVGREDIYDEYYSRVAGENYHKFTKGTTFRGNDIEQGHQIFDLIDEEGDFVAYKIGANLIKDVSEIDLSKVVEQKQNDTINVVNKLFNYYSNNFAFREFLDKHVEYIEVYNGRHGKLLKESQKLKQYISTIEKITKDYQKNYIIELNKKIAAWSEQFNVKLGIKKAKTELNLDTSIERKRSLLEYIENVRLAEQEAKRGFHDAEYTVELAQFAKEYGDEDFGNIAQRVSNLENIVETQKSLTSLFKKLEKVQGDIEREEVIRNEISMIFKNSSIGHADDSSWQSLDVLENYINEIKTPPTAVSNQAIWKKTFERAHQNFKLIVKNHKRRFGEAMILASETVTPPKGIFGRSDAEWELSVNLTEERKAQLQNYIDQYDDYVATLKTGFEKDFKEKIEAVESVNGLNSTEKVLARLEDITSILSKRYIPSSDHPKYRMIKEMVEDLQILDKELAIKDMNSLVGKVQNLESKILKLKKDRSDKIGKLQEFLDQIQPSTTLDKSTVRYKKDLDRLISVNERYANAQEEFYIDLFERDAMTRENILNIPEHLRGIAKEYEDALEIADQSAANLKIVKLTEAAKGNLTSNLDPDGQQLKELLYTLLGDFKILAGKVEPGESSLEKKLSDLVNKQAVAESSLFKVRLKIVELEREYLKLLSEVNTENSFLEVHSVSLKNALDQDLDTLLENLNSNEGKVILSAFKKTLYQWEELWNRINVDDNFKQTDSYNLSM